MNPTRLRGIRLGIGVSVLLLVAGLVGAVEFVNVNADTADSQVTPGVPPAPPPAVARPEVIAVGDTAPRPSGAGLAKTLATALADPSLGQFTGRISDALTGETLWARRDDVPMQPASTNKVLTAAAALLALQPDARLITRVVVGDEPGVVVLVGGGDPTLSSAEPGNDTWYRAAARITDLAEQVRRNSDAVPTAILVDTAMFSGTSMAPGWDALDIEGGDIAPIEPVMIDGGRTQPTTVDSKRTRTPALDAGRVLAARLGIDPGRVSLGSAPGNARELGAVSSAPLTTRLWEMVTFSDNVLAECIGREVAAAAGRPQSFAGAAEAVTNRLTTANIPMNGAWLRDSSGLSVDDRLDAGTLAAVVAAAAGPDHPELRPLLDLLPVAGGSGTLSERYAQAPNRVAAGWLRAKTGSLDGTNALVGIVTDRDWRVLTFAFISNEAGPAGRRAIDTVAATLRTCGCRP